MISKLSIKLGKATVKAEFAHSFWQKSFGLMFKPKLPSNNGMFFDFYEEQYPGMWMAFMNFPIDFIWIDSCMKIVDITENARPWQMKIFYPRKAARYVLEVPAGFCRKEKIEIGNNALFGENTK